MPTWAGLAEDGAQAGQDSSSLINTFLKLFWPLSQDEKQLLWGCSVKDARIATAVQPATSLRGRQLTPHRKVFCSLP